MLDQHSYQVLGVGAACIDLLIPVSEEFLSQVPGKKGGAEAIDFESLEQIIKESGQTPHIATGGSCANTIKGLANLGTRSALLSTIGADIYGEHFTLYMQKLGILPFFRIYNQPTACVLCLITPDGQRTMRFCAGCSNELTEFILHGDYFKNVKIVHIDSYSFRNGTLVSRVMEKAKAAGAQISLDLSSFEIVRAYKEIMFELIPKYVDIVFANEDETRELTGLDPFEGCLALQKICPIAVVLRGKNGCLVGHNGSIIASPAFPVNVVDTTGSGDLFASGFLYGYLKGCSLEECARLGNRLGGLVTEVTGAEIPENCWEIVRREFP